MAYFALLPLLYLLGAAFFEGNALTLGHFVDAFTAPHVVQLLKNSLVFAFGSAALAVVLGTTMAYLAVRTDVPLKGLVYASSLVPLVLPGILYTTAWVFLGSPRIGIYSRMLGGAIDIYSMPGMILVDGLMLSPLVFLLMFAALKSMDPSLEESAYVSGARTSTVLRRIIAPLMRPAFFGAVLVMVVRGLESFEVPAILGMPSGNYVLTSQIYRVLSQFPADYGQAAAYAVSLLVITSAFIFWESRSARNAKAFQTITGKGYRPRTNRLGRLRWPVAGVVVVYFLIAVAMPLFILVFESTQPFFAVPSSRSLGMASLGNYAAIFSNETTLTALTNSLVLGLTAATAVMLVMAIVSWIIVRTNFPGRWVLDNLSFVPLTIPGIVLGVALLFVYLRVPLPIYGTLLILFVAYFTRYMPYGMRFAAASMRQVAGELEEAAAASGVGWWPSFRRITLPLIMPGIVGGWLYVFILSIRELSQSILLYSPGHEVLSVVIWEQLANGQLTQLSALGVVMVAISAVAVVGARRLGGKIGV